MMDSYVDVISQLETQQTTGLLSRFKQRRAGTSHDRPRLGMGVTKQEGQLCLREELATMRVEYDSSVELLEANVHSDPIQQFRAWLLDARHCEAILEPNAMILATATRDGHPSSRTVLLKHVDDDPAGFVFFTNYNSRKGRELNANPFVCLTFYWGPLQRQVHIEGVARKVPDAVSEAYFQSRPLGNRIAAVVSPQSQVLESKEALVAKFRQYDTEYAAAEDTTKVYVPRPPHWGGYRVEPTAIEFWQGGRYRVHDRLKYIKETHEPSWKIVRLAP